MKVIILLGLMAMASCQENTIEASFNFVDSNNDHHLVLEEFLQYFDRIDTDGDKCITIQEFTASDRASAHNADVRGAYNFYDNLGGAADHCVDYSDVRSLFGRFDDNGDGQVNMHEFETEWPALQTDIQHYIDRIPVGK